MVYSSPFAFGFDQTIERRQFFFPAQRVGLKCSLLGIPQGLLIGR